MAGSVSATPARISCATPSRLLIPAGRAFHVWGYQLHDEATVSRDAGFAIADVASDHLDDDKVRKLWRLLGSQPEMCAAVTLHLAVILSSWREGRRVTA